MNDAETADTTSPKMAAPRDFPVLLVSLESVIRLTGGSAMAPCDLYHQGRTGVRPGRQQLPEMSP
jgi:hypothetical protein